MWDDLVCPADYGPLDRFGTQLSCRNCGAGYPVLESLPTFLADDESAAWRRHQRRSIARLPRGPREARVTYSPVVRERGRQLEALLGEHLSLGSRSRILQVGPGAEGEVHHFQTGLRYAVDPLAGVLAERRLLRWGQVRWVAARGERLPFPDGCFSAVILSEVLDWVDSPRRVLHEAWRCLSGDGLLYVAQSEERTAPLRRLSLETIQRLAAGFRVVEAGSRAAVCVPAAAAGAVAGSIVPRDERFMLLARATSSLRVLAAA